MVKSLVMILGKIIPRDVLYKVLSVRFLFIDFILIKIHIYIIYKGITPLTAILEGSKGEY